MVRRSAAMGWAVVALATAVCAVPHARADDFVDRANAAYSQIPPELRSDLVLLPLLSRLDERPAALTDVRAAMLIPAGSAAWGAIEAWAAAAPQQAVLAALRQVTSEEDYRRAYAFGQPYGAEGVPVELVRAGLYTELGDPPSLAGAQHKYLPSINDLMILVHVEATRLAAGGDPSSAIELLTSLVYFGRQLADRVMTDEAGTGYQVMRLAARRIRDVVYVDARSGSPRLDQARVREVVRRLDDNVGTYLDSARLPFPVGDRLAAEQLIARTYVERGGVDPDAFSSVIAQTMARQEGIPLRLFSASVEARTVAGIQVNWFDITQALDRAWNDLAARWPLDPFDPRHALQHEYATLGPQHMVILAAVTRPLELFGLRQTVRVELVGTRTALAINGFAMDAKSFPRDISAVRPRYVDRIQADPWNPDREHGRQPPLEYFVPIRDQQRGEREDPRPHTLNVFPGGGENFRVDVRDDQFILYSVGADGGKDWAREVHNDPAARTGDYLIWPPILSLQRKHYLESGQLK